MLQRRTSANGATFYQSPILSAIGVRHAFSTRIGGISPAPFDSLNLGNPNGCEIQDDYDRIWKNYGMLLTAIECNPTPPIRVHQVHGNVVVQVKPEIEFDTSCKADAIVSNDANRPISVRVADCVPVLISTADGKHVAAVHAGWRGVIAGIVARAIKALASNGHKSQTFVAAVGPCISMDAFEVGPEVLAEFESSFGSRAPIRHAESRKGFVDLRKAVHLQLVDAGVPEQSIDETDRCTYGHEDEFFSHRRDNGITGRMAAIICPS